MKNLASTRQTYLFLEVFIVMLLHNAFGITSGPLSSGGYRISAIPTLTINQQYAITINKMNSDWTVDTTPGSKFLTVEGFTGSPTYLTQQNFENTNMGWNILFSPTGQATNVTVDSTVAAKGTSSSALLTNGFNTDNWGPYFSFGSNVQPKRIGAYMRACCASVAGLNLALVHQNATGTFYAGGVFFHSDNTIKMKRLNGVSTVYSVSTSYTPNMWYKVDVIFDWTAFTADLWVDGDLITSGFPLYSGSGGLVMYNYQSTTSWVDELEVVLSDNILTQLTVSPSTIRINKGDVTDTIAVSGAAASMVIRVFLQENGYYAEGISNPFDCVLPTPSPTSTPSRTPSISVSPSRTPSISVSPSKTPSISVSPSRTPSSSTSPSVTPTPFASPSVTPSITPSVSPTPSVTPSKTPTPSVTPSTTPSLSVTPSNTRSPSVTPSASATSSVTPTPYASTSITPTPSISETPPPTKTPSPSIVYASPSNDTTIPTPNSKSSSLPIIVGTSVGVAALCVAAGVAVKLRRRKPREDDVELRGLSGTMDMPAKPIYQTFSSEPEFTRWQIPYESLKLGHEIGRGAFGSVFTAMWRNSECVVKQLHIDNTNPSAVQEFLKEANTVQKLRPHKNVCTMFGVCTNPEYPICIVMEYVKDGSLKDLVYEPPKIELTSLLILGFAKDIVSGMSHLHMENLLHCDLACRNLLVQKQGESYLVKVSDFGLARTSESGIYDASQEAKFPIRWSAPEVLSDRKISRGADVWSFGVVLWEMLEGKMPYWDMLSNSEVMLHVCTKRQFLQPPTKRFDYPEELYAIMLACFQFRAEDRPSFGDLFTQLDELEQQVKKMKDIEEPQLLTKQFSHIVAYETSNSQFVYGNETQSANTSHSIYGNEEK